jgi:soluble lytic murein transglycosylase-like protein
MIFFILLLVGGAVLLYLGHKPSLGQIATAAKNAGFTGDDLAIAIAIAYAESGGNPNAVGDQNLAPDRGPSIGLWQINIGSAAHPEYASVDLTDPQTNANAAFDVYKQAGNSFRPWSTFLTGKYEAYLSQAQSAEISA